MEIAIDVTPLESGHSGRGIGVYTQLLVESLQKYEKEHTYSLFTRGQKIPNTIDLIHYPYFDPFFLTLPLVKVKPTVVTVHDLIPLVFPDKFPAGLRGNVKWQIQKKSLKGANRIITDSENSKKDINSIVGFDKQKIDVVHLAPSDSFNPIKNKTQLDRVRKKYHVPDQFILYVGDVNWNKNVEGLMRAFTLLLKTVLLKGQSFRDLKLVLIGKAFLDATLKETQQINSFLDTAGLKREVIRIGGVSTDDLVAIYNLASVYVQPSLYEGFGLPVLEAMACGCPVVTSTSSSLSEIAGPAIRVDPTDPNDIATRLHVALTMPMDKRQTLIQKGILWAKRYSWKAVARQTVQSYGKAIA